MLEKWKVYFIQKNETDIKCFNFQRQKNIKNKIIEEYPSLN